MDVQQSFGIAVGELEKMLTSKTVVGSPIDLNGATVIPLVSVGFGFAVAAGQGTGPKDTGAGEGGGTGGGGGVRPVAVLIADSAGVRVESLRTAVSVLGKVAESISEIVRAREGKAVEPKKGP